MKKVLLLLLILVVSFSTVFAQGSEESTKPSTETESDGVTEITFLSSSVKPYCTAMPEMIAAFEEENPDIKVKLEMLPTKSIWEMVEVRLGAKESTPDVVFTDGPLVTSYAFKDYLEPLDSYFTEEELSQYLPVPLSACQVNGKMYATPFLNSSQVLYYNTDMFDAAGIDRLSKDPADRLTWEEVVELAQKLTTDKDNDGVPEVFGLGIVQISRPYQMLTMPESKGGQAIGKDGLTVKGILTTDEWKEACQFIQDVFNKYNVSPKGVSSSDMLAYFPSGKLAMCVGPDYNVNAYSQLEGFNWDYAPYPYFEGGTPVTPSGSWCLGVNKNSDKKEASVKLIKYLTQAPGCIKWFEMDGHLPTNVNTMAFIAENAKYKEWPFDMFTLLNYESANTAVPRPSTPSYLEYESMLTNAFEDIRNGADIDETLANTEARIEKSLQKYQ